MKQTVVPTSRAGGMDGQSGVRVQGKRDAGPSHLRIRSICLGIVAAVLLILLIIIGSRGFHWFDAALIGYAVATIFATAAVTYKYTFWLDRPPTGRYFWRSWKLFFSFENFRSYTLLIPKAILDLFAQQFIRRRGWYRWITHQCIF